MKEGPRFASSKGVMRYAEFTVALFLVPGCTAIAAPVGSSQYEACLARAQGDPEAALMLAEAWQKKGGAGAADHCAAVALVGLRRFAEAGSKLDALARSDFAGSASTRSDLFDQAGNAWLLGGQPDKAIVSFSAALAVDPADADLLADRARAQAFSRNWAKAESDLSAALMVNPNRADLYVLRGSARHAMGRRPDARADFDRALKLQPGYPDALVERGTAKFEAGDITGARADWQQVVSSAPNSAAAESAQQHLADSAQSPATTP